MIARKSQHYTDSVIKERKLNTMKPNDFTALLARIRNGMTTQDDEKIVNTLALRVLDMKHALDFYSNQVNYLPFSAAGQSPIDLDNGEKAREALGV
jgi:hypothetical protein